MKHWNIGSGSPAGSPRLPLYGDGRSSGYESSLAAAPADGDAQDGDFERR